MARIIGGIIAGVVIAFLLVTLLEMVGHYVFPPPPLDYSDPESRRLALANAPAGAFITVLIAYAAASLFGGLTAARIAQTGAWPAWVIAGLLLVGTLVNVVLLPHPIWFTLFALIIITAGGWISGQLATGQPLLPRGLPTANDP